MKKYIVKLTDEERAALRREVKARKGSARRVLDGEQEAKISALRPGAEAVGKRAVELGIVEHVSRQTF